MTGSSPATPIIKMKQENTSNGWRTLAIILLVIVVLETLVIGWAWNIGTTEIKNQNECSLNICAEADAYYYGDGVCECYSAGEIYHSYYFG